MTVRTATELEDGLADVLAAPRDEGSLRLVVRRTGRGLRELLEEAELDLELGLVGDDWVNRAGLGSDRPSLYAQVTLINARFAELISGSPSPEAWAQAGDQLYIDLDISTENLPAGSRLRIGDAVIEISAEPHTGCVQFSSRFGSDALRKTNTQEGRSLRLRGANARILQPGLVRQGDLVSKA